MRSALDDFALVEHDDLIGAHDGGQSMRNHQRRAVAGNTLKGILNFPFGMAVERRGRLIKYQDGRTF